MSLNPALEIQRSLLPILGMIHAAAVPDPASPESRVAVEAGSGTTALYIPSRSVSHPRNGHGMGGTNAAPANLGWQKRKVPAHRLILHFKEYLSVQMQLLIPPHSLQPYYPPP